MRTTLLLTNFTSGELSPRLDGRVDLSKYFNGCRRLENFLVHSHGGAYRRSGFRFVAEAGNQNSPSRLVPFEFNTEQAYVLEFCADAGGQGFLRVFQGQGQVLSEGEVYQIETPYGAEDLERLRWVQSGDTLILTHPDHAPRKLVRTDHDAWTLEAISFTGMPEAWTENEYPGVACFFEERLVLAGTLSKPNTLWFSRSSDYFDFRLNTREVPLDDWDDQYISDGNNDGKCDGKQGDEFLLLAGLVFEKDNVLKGQNPDGGKRWFRYKGDVRIETPLNDNFTVDFTDGTPNEKQVESIYNGSGELNGDLWESLELGQRIENPTGESPLDDDAIEITLSSAQANSIEFLVPRARLWVGTVGGEWTVGGASGGAITPSSIKAAQEGTAGAARAPVAAVGHAGLYIQRAGRKVREMAYRLDFDSYASRDLTILSEHITAPGLADLTYVQEPDSVLFALRSDGVLVSLTYEPDQEVYAWGRQLTAGSVESLTSIYNAQTKRDELWVVAQRTVGGQERRFVEFLEAGFEGEAQDAFFVDSGLTYSGDPVQVIAGLDHLAGEDVAVLADGAVHRNMTVAQDGTISLDWAASVVQAGLPYVSVIEPMRLEGASRQTTDQSKAKRIVQVAARFHRTLGGAIGPDTDHLEPVYYRSSSDAMGQAPALFTGDKIIKFPRGWESEARLVIVQDRPLPMTVLLLVPQVIVNQ